jgi:hypothetical protein
VESILLVLRATVSIVVVLSLGFGWLRAGWADSSPDDASAAGARAAARAKLVKGGELANEGDFKGALAQFQQAYELVPSPKILYNFGVAYQGLGRSAEAFEAFQRFLAQAGDAPPQARLNAERALTDLAAQIAWLTVTADVSGAEIFLDGQSRGRTPRTTAIHLDPGPHQLSVEARGRDAIFAERLNLTAGERLNVRAHLERRAPGLAPRSPAGVSAVDTTAAPAPPSGHPWHRPAAWTAAGLGGLAVGFGVVEGLSYNSQMKEFNRRPDCWVDLPDRGGGPCRTLHDDARRAYVRAVGALAAGGAFAITSAILFLTLPPRPARQALSMSCGPAGGAGVACLGRF